MNTTYICSLGTSIANRLPDEKMLSDRQKKNLPWEADDPEFEKALRQYAASVPTSGDQRDSCCAEATILAKMKVAPGDRIRLLATDTCLGRICGEAVQSVLVRCFGLDPDDVSVARVEDLQVGDAKRLRESGIKNLLDMVRKNAETDRNRGREVCLCPNGGYKGVVPFLTLAGMVLHCKVVYTFEHIGSVIVLPPLPFALDAEAYLRARDAIVRLYDEIEMPEARFLSMVTDLQPGERDRFLGFTEPSGTPGFVTLSPLVEIATAGAEVQSAWLSPQAVKDLAKMGNGIPAANCRRLALRAQDPLYRGMHLDGKYATDLDAVSLPRTPERVMGYVHEGRFLVCRIFADHDGYERFLDKQRATRKDFPPETFTETPLRDPSESAGEPDATESWMDLKTDRDRLKIAGQNLQNDNARLREELADGQEEIKKGREAQKRCEKQEKRLAEYHGDLARTRKELDKVRAALDDALRQTEEGQARAEALQNELESVSAELAAAHARIDAESRLEFFARLRRVFVPDPPLNGDRGICRQENVRGDGGKRPSRFPMNFDRLDRLVAEKQPNICQICVRKDGREIYSREWNGYRKTDCTHVMSATKGIVALLVGIAVDLGMIGGVDDKVLSFFPDYLPKRGEKTIFDVTLRHLLTMRAPWKGKGDPWTKVCSSENWTEASLDFLGGRRGLTDAFDYRTVCLHVLSGILHRATGMAPVDFANRFLFAPLGIPPHRNYVAESAEEHRRFILGKTPKGNVWFADPQGLGTPGYGLCLSAADMAKIAQLCLREGCVGGRRIVSRGWIRQMTAPRKVESGMFRGMDYGFLWWIVHPGKNVVAAIGNSGNVIYADPGKDIAVGIASYFKPTVFDRIDFLEGTLLPALEACT